MRKKIKRNVGLNVNCEINVAHVFFLLFFCVASFWALVKGIAIKDGCGKDSHFVCSVEETDLADQPKYVYTVKVPDDMAIQSVSTQVYLDIGFSGARYLVPIKAKQTDYITSQGDLMIQLQSTKQLIKSVAGTLGIGMDRVQMKPCLEIEDQDGTITKFLLASGELLSWDEAVHDVVKIEVSLDITDEENLQEEIDELFSLMF